MSYERGDWQDFLPPLVFPSLPDERAAIVAFLRRPTSDKARLPSVDREHMAQCIERGEHLK